jgi:hypothetical protein
MPKKTKLKPKEEKEKIKEKPSLSQEETNSLEQRIEKEEEIDTSELREFLGESKAERTSPSLKKINAPQILTRFETNIIEASAGNTNLKEEEDSINYSLINKKNEQEYKLISQESRIVQRESIKQNPNLLMKEPSFIDLERKNIVENFPKRTFNAIADENLKGGGNVDKNYIIRPSFVEKERKPHNTFEKKDIKYNTFEQ